MVFFLRIFLIIVLSMTIARSRSHSLLSPSPAVANKRSVGPGPREKREPGNTEGEHRAPRSGHHQNREGQHPTLYLEFPRRWVRQESCNLTRRYEFLSLHSTLQGKLCYIIHMAQPDSPSPESERATIFRSWEL